MSELPEWCGADCIGGNCPVQAEGKIGDAYWYFRARGDHWSITVHADPEQVYGNSDGALYYHDEPYGDWPEAGWMPRAEAAAFIVRELTKWRDAATKAVRGE